MANRYARPTPAGGGAGVYVTTPTNHPRVVVGYYALAAAQVEPPDATERMTRGRPSRRAVPVVLLARLAVDRAHQGRRLGSSLLRDAMLRVLQAADAIGIRALVVHAKHERARTWYERYGFEPSPRTRCTSSSSSRTSDGSSSDRHAIARREGPRPHPTGVASTVFVATDSAGTRASRLKRYERGAFSAGGGG